MLVHLDIHDLAIIEHTALPFGEGLNVLTGETGAGKSIVVGALDLVLGGRARSDSVRRGAKRAEVQALLRVSPDAPLVARLRELDLLVEDDTPAERHVEVVVRRIVAGGGRGRAYVNGGLVTIGTLAQLMRGVVDISSQHEHTALLDAGFHLELLDRFGGHVAERAAFDAAWTRLSACRSHLQGLRERERDRLTREDYVRFQLTEIERVQPVPDEDLALEAERERLVHAERLRTGAREVEQALSGKAGSACDLALGGIRALDRLTPFDPSLQPYAARLEVARIELEDIAYEMRRYSDSVDRDPRRLDVVEERLDDLRRLKRKHCLDIPGLVARATELREELEAFESLEEAVAAAEVELAELSSGVLTAAEALSAARHRAASQLDAQVGAQLTDLAMDGAAVRMRVDTDDTPGPRGLDRAELLIRPNVGEGEKSLSRVASGGELSRVLLALKAVLGVNDDVSTAVFDEVDSGVGGAVAEVIGLKLKQLSQERQVITITHLPQIAALARHHLQVRKQAVSGRTVTLVEGLTPKQRAEELARMLGGLEITDHTRAHAAELLERGAAA